MEFTKEEIETIESEIQFTSFKRTIQYRNDYLTHEISCGVNPVIGLEKTNKFIQQKVNYLLQRDMQGMDGGYDKIIQYKKEKGVNK